MSSRIACRTFEADEVRDALVAHHPQEQGQEQQEAANGNQAAAAEQTQAAKTVQLQGREEREQRFAEHQPVASTATGRPANASRRLPGGICIEGRPRVSKVRGRAELVEKAACPHRCHLNGGFVAAAANQSRKALAAPCCLQASPRLRPDFGTTLAGFPRSRADSAAAW